MATLNNDCEPSEKNCDIILIVDGHKYPAHKCVLSQRSPFFEKIFCSKIKKHCSDEIMIEGISKEVFEVILDMTYLDKVYVNDELLHPSKEVADYLGIEYELHTNWWYFTA